MEKKSKFLSLILRHKPDSVNIKLDKNGWALCSEIIKVLAIDITELHTLVKYNNKQRAINPETKKPWDEPEVKEKLQENTLAAERAGVFGVPSFRIPQPHGEPLLFFGQDRMKLVERALRKGTRSE